jgi:hypothetical protein
MIMICFAILVRWAILLVMLKAHHKILLIYRELTSRSDGVMSSTDLILLAEQIYDILKRDGKSSGVREYSYVGDYYSKPVDVALNSSDGFNVALMESRNYLNNFDDDNYNQKYFRPKFPFKLVGRYGKI